MTVQARRYSSVVGIMALCDSVSCFAGVPAAPAQRPSPALRATTSEPRVESGASSGFTTAACSLVAAGVVGVAANRRRSSAKVARQAVGVGINGFGRIGRQVARIVALS